MVATARRAAVLLGMLAACQSKAAAARRTMRESLRRLAVAEAAFYARHGTYTSYFDSLGMNGRPLAWREDVRLVIVRADTGGWRGVASSLWTEEVCRLALGAPGRDAAAGEPECR